MSVKIYKSKIAYTEEIAESVHKLNIPLNEGETIDFQAGQFINLLVAPGVRSSYSVASPPSYNTGIDLIADSVIGGPGSQFFANAKVGDEVEFIGPLGNFVYKEESKPAYIFATGTGAVPFISMITYALETLHTTRTIKLFLGFRHEKNIFYKYHFERLASSFPNFEFILTLSQPEADWQGYRGRITEHYLKAVEIEKDFAGYVCGSRKMIDDVVLNLTNAGVVKENIYYEQYY